MRIKILQNHKQYRKGDIVTVTAYTGFGLINSGLGILSKDMADIDMRKK